MSPLLTLAPMQGVMDSQMRALLTSLGGIDLTVTEFLRVTDKLNPEHVFHRICPELASGSRTPSGIPVHLQLLGGQPQPMAENAARACELGALGIDLNFGCPAPTVNRHDGGATLLQWPHRVFDITAAVRKAVPLHVPVSVKIRLGYMDKELYLENSLAAEAAGAGKLTVHARTKIELYNPPAHWEYIGQISDALKIPIVANGDIWTVEDALRCQTIAKTPYLMLGRGVLSSPYLALDIKNCLSQKEQKAQSQNTLKLLEHYFKQGLQELGPAYSMARTKQWLRYLETANPQLQGFSQQFKRAASIEQCKELFLLDT